MKLYIGKTLDPKVGDIIVCRAGNIVVTDVYEYSFTAGDHSYGKQWPIRFYQATDAHIMCDCKMAIVYMTVYPRYIKQS
jgi:hypothetical protein